MLGIADLAFRVMPLTMKLKVGFEVFAEVFNRFSDHKVRLEEEESKFLWVMDPCGFCWGRTTSSPCCYIAVGLLQEALFWVSGGRHFDVNEIACVAAGDQACVVEIVKNPLG